MSIAAIIAVIGIFALAPAAIAVLTRTGLAVSQRNSGSSTWVLAINLLFNFAYFASTVASVLIATQRDLPLWPCAIGQFFAASYLVVTFWLLRRRGRPDSRTRGHRTWLATAATDRASHRARRYDDSEELR